MAEGTKRIEQLAPELERIISPSEAIHDLAEGFGGPLGPAEGPLWWKEGRHLLFSDIHNNKRMKYEPGKGVSLVLEPTNRANGLTRDLQGLVDREGAGPQSLGQSLPLGQFHDERSAVARFFDAVYRRDVRVAQRRQHPR